MHRLTIVLPFAVIVLAACHAAEDGSLSVCPGVTISASPYLELGDGAESYSPTQHSRATHLPSGLILVAPTASPGHVAVFDAQGRFVTSFGQDGAGPGEFRDIVDMVTIGDTSFIADRRLSRVSVHGADGAFVRAFTVNGTVRSLARMSDSLVVNAPSAHQEGETLKVFHKAPTPAFAVSPSRQSSASRSALEVAVTDSFIVALSRTSLSLQRFGHTGTHAGDVEIRVDWFREARLTERVVGSGFSIVKDVIGAANNRLNVLVYREREGAERFREAVRAEPEALAKGMSLPLQDSVFDYYLAAIDPTGRCVSEPVLFEQGVFTGFTDGGALIEVVTQPDGAEILRLWRVDAT